MEKLVGTALVLVLAGLVGCSQPADGSGVAGTVNQDDVDFGSARYGVVFGCGPSNCTDSSAEGLAITLVPEAVACSEFPSDSLDFGVALEEGSHDIPLFAWRENVTVGGVVVVPPLPGSAPYRDHIADLHLEVELSFTDSEGQAIGSASGSVDAVHCSDFAAP